MPQWLIYSLAFCGAVDIVIALLKLVTKPLFRIRRRGRSQRVRIASLKDTVYRLEQDVHHTRDMCEKQGEVLGDIWKANKLMEQELAKLTTWAKQVKTVTDLWETKVKEAGPDGP